MTTRETEDRTLRASATSRYQVPGFRIPQGPGITADQARFYREVASWINLREGTAGNAQERAVLQRDLNAAGINRATTEVLQAISRQPSTSPATPIGGGKPANAQSTLEKFANSIFNTRVFQSLMKGANDPSRFKQFSDEVQRILLNRIDEEAKTRGAAIRRLETIQQTAAFSQAISSQEITASVFGAMAGVRVTSFATAQAGRATAGIVTQVQARLDDVDGSGASVEEVLSATADSITGLEAQWTMKVSANGAWAGIGLSATSPTVGPSTSTILLQADRIAFVRSSDVLGTGPGQINPLSPPTTRLLFGVDSDGAYVGGNLKVTGIGSIDGTYTKGSYTSALHVNFGHLSNNGVTTYASGSASFRAALNAIASSGAYGVNAAASGGGPAGHFVATATGYAIRARATVFNANPALIATNEGVGIITQCELATPTYCVYSPAGKGKAYAVDGLGPFTGFHDALMPLPLVEGDYIPQDGDIVVDADLVEAPDVNNSLFTGKPCTQVAERGAIGIISGTMEIDNAIGLSYENWWNLQHTHLRAQVNGVGEGQVNVCGRGGNIARGDLIVCSDMQGKGQRQGDDYVRSYTVARARASVVFSHPDEVKLVPCVYLCG